MFCKIVFTIDLSLRITGTEMSVSSCEDIMTPPMISVTSPRETNEKTIFFPLKAKVAVKRSFARAGEHQRRSIVIVNSRAVKNSPSVLPHLKPDIPQPDPGQLGNTADYMSNKENLLDFNDGKKHVITTRYGLARRNTYRVMEHVLPNVLNMSGSQTQVKKVKIAPGALRAQGMDLRRATATKPLDKKLGVTSERKLDNHTHFSAGVSGVRNSRSPRISPTEKSSKYSAGKGTAKPTGTKTKTTKSKHDSLPQVNLSLLQVKDSERRDDRTRVSPISSLGQITEESSAEASRRRTNLSATKPKGQGTYTERNARTPKKVTPNASPATRTGRSDESRQQSLEERVQELELPKVTMNEVLQSWNIGPPSRTRSTSLAGKDPMEFLLSRERSDSDPKQRTTTVEELRRCRYLRTGGKDDHERHSKVCSCNSCEHGEGLKSTPYLNS